VPRSVGHAVLPQHRVAVTVGVITAAEDLAVVADRAVPAAVAPEAAAKLKIFNGGRYRLC
jgi:hypothetical protein